MTKKTSGSLMDGSKTGLDYKMGLSLKGILKIAGKAVGFAANPVGSVIGMVAPTLTKALSNSDLAGGAIDVISNALGIPAQQVPNRMQSLSPEDIGKIKSAEVEYETALVEAGVDIAKIEADSVADARDMAEKTGLGPHIVLSFLFVVGYFAILFGLLTGWLAMPALEKDLIILLLGIMTREVGAVMAFWFGSSSGSKSKTDALGSALNKK